MTIADHKAPNLAAVRVELSAIFVSLELSRTSWLVTSLSPGGGEKMSKHAVRAGDVAGLLGRLAWLRERARTRTGRTFPVVAIQEAGLDGFWVHRALEGAGVESQSSIPPRSPSPAGTVGRRRTGSTARRWCAPCWPSSEGSPGCARWCGRRPRRRKIAAGSAVSAGR
jgi:hypothetical protein